jgi:hypothetical protein
LAKEGKLPLGWKLVLPKKPAPKAPTTTSKRKKAPSPSSEEFEVEEEDPEDESSGLDDTDEVSVSSAPDPTPSKTPAAKTPKVRRELVPVITETRVTKSLPKGKGREKQSATTRDSDIEEVSLIGRDLRKLAPAQGEVVSSSVLPMVKDAVS